MVVIPCSAGALSRIAYGMSLDLVGRAADVMLKERRRLLLVVREAPVSLVHARAMVAAIEAGAMVLPASPSFYSGAKTLEALVDTVVARVLDKLDLPNALMKRWTGMNPRAPSRANRSPLTMLSPLANRALERDGLGPIRDKVLSGERLSDEDGLSLFEATDLPGAGSPRQPRPGDPPRQPRLLQPQRPPEPHQRLRRLVLVLLVRQGGRCAGRRRHTMRVDEAWRRLSHGGRSGTEVHIVNGLHPDLPFSYYTELLSRIRTVRPDLAIKCFTAVEIHFFAEKFGMTHEEVLLRLRAAGLDTLPGGGAEIFAPGVRRKICDDKATAEEWLEVHRIAHRLGIRTNSTMLYGHIERFEHRVDHMRRLRELQDETDGFQAFIPLAFHPEDNGIGRTSPSPPATTPSARSRWRGSSSTTSTT